MSSIGRRLLNDAADNKIMNGMVTCKLAKCVSIFINVSKRLLWFTLSKVMQASSVAMFAMNNAIQS